MNHFSTSFTLFEASREKYELVYRVLVAASHRYAIWNPTEVHVITDYTERTLDAALSAVLATTDQLKIVKTVTAPVARPPLVWELGALADPRRVQQARLQIRELVLCVKSASARNSRAA